MSLRWMGAQLNYLRYAASAAERPDITQRLVGQNPVALFEIIGQILSVVSGADQVRSAANSHAPPRPYVSGRTAVVVSASVLAVAVVYWRTFAALGKVSTTGRTALGVAVVVAATVVIFLVGNQLDAALSRRRMAVRDATKGKPGPGANRPAKRGRNHR